HGRSGKRKYFGERREKSVAMRRGGVLSMARSIQPVLKEFAPAAPEALDALIAGRRLGDHIVRSEGFAGHVSAYSLFEEMEDKDGHLFSLLQTRKLGVLARARKIEPAGTGPRDREIARWV